MIAATWRDWSAVLAARSRAWARQRQGSDKLQAELHARRIYILPTRAGLVYGAIVFLLLISSMNFSNNMGFALTFLLTGIGLVSMQHCQRNLARLRLGLTDTQACFAGERAGFLLRFANPTPAPRWQLQVGWDKQPGQALKIAGESCADLTLQHETRARGRMQAPRIRISSVFPLGLFRAWAWVHLDASAIVWPQPAAHAVPVGGAGQDHTAFNARQPAGDDLSGVRDYQYGDSPRRIDWKALARSGELRVREYQDGGVAKTWLDWDALEGHDTETRLSILTRLALDAEAEGLIWGLRMPGRIVQADTGTPHLHGCLDLLALHGLEHIARNGVGH
jgi:uncharacterized protein (DUF58 family)